MIGIIILERLEVFMKKIKILLIFIIILLGCVGCGKKEKVVTKEDAIVDISTPEPVTTPELETQTPEPTETEESHEGEVRSKLTGLWIPEEVGKKRPYAIMFNNIKIASPQSGTSEADILYEAIVEGGITRLMGIFEQITSDRIGSVRSARHYFVSFADEYDAIFVHYGQTKYATAKIESLHVDNLSGLSGIGTTVFFRDNSIKAPHNAFASKNGILKGTESLKYDTEYDDDYEGHYTFYEKDTNLKSETKVNKVTLNFSNYTSPYFTYDKDTKSYARFQFGAAHVDANNNQQLTFKNIIIQYVKEWNIDKNGYQTMDIENSSGKGYYISNGKAINITWKKNESTKKMRYYNEDGSELTLNPGKTYIGIFPDNRTNGVVFE